MEIFCPRFPRARARVVSLFLSFFFLLHIIKFDPALHFFRSLSPSFFRERAELRARIRYYIYTYIYP